MPESESTRPLPPARILPPPSAPPGYQRAPGGFRNQVRRIERPQQPTPPLTQRPPPTPPSPAHHHGQHPGAGRPLPQSQQPTPHQTQPSPQPAPYGPPAPAPYAGAPAHHYVPQEYRQSYDRHGQGQVYPPRADQKYRLTYPPPQRHGAYQHPQWGYGWAPAPPRRHTGAKVSLALIGVLAAVVFVLVLVNAMTGAVGAKSDSVAVDHSPARASNPNANPVDTSNARAVLDANTLYAQGGLANGDCPAHALGDAGTAEQTDFYRALMSCLNDEWRIPIESAGYDYTEPGLVVFDSAINTPCGNASPEDGRTLAFYCPSDEVMYADVPQMRRFFGDNDVAYAIVIGHEFGHHVQNEVGALDAFEDVSYDDFDNRLELNRRVELQASCLGGLFLGAIAASYPMDETKLQQLSRVAGSFGDEPGGDDGDRDHGSGASNREWINTGYGGNDLARCNTFAARADEVD
ncbi:MAG: neutral zinc metallopeptidase [Nocardioidaceae bacterium]